MKWAVTTPKNDKQPVNTWKMFIIIFLIYLGCVPIYQLSDWKAEDHFQNNLHAWALSFHHVGCEDRIHAVRAGRRCLCSLSQPTSPGFSVSSHSKNANQSFTESSSHCMQSGYHKETRGVGEDAGEWRTLLHQWWGLNKGSHFGNQYGRSSEMEQNCYMLQLHHFGVSIWRN